MKAISQLPPISKAGEEDPRKMKLKKACEDFESVITGYLFKSMRETVPQSDEGVDGQAKELYESMMDQAVAKQLSHRPGLGMARLLYKQLAYLVDDQNHNLKSPPSSSDKLVGGDGGDPKARKG
jgi:flagellar protein FlgJ